MRVATCLISALILLYPREAQLSRTRYDESITLEQMVTDSALIVVVRADSPPFREESRKILKGPPFTWRIYRYRVVQVLKPLDAPDSPAPGSGLEVTAYDDQSFDLHRRYHEEGLSKSTVERLYSSGVKDFIADAADRGIVVFLREADGEPGGAPYRFHNPSGFESITRSDEIKRRVESLGPSGSS